MASLNGEVILDEDGNTVYPYIQKQKFGYKVHMNSRRSLPGLYTSYHQGKLAMEKDIAVHNSIKLKRAKDASK